jgi:hypothetical protein
MSPYKARSMDVNVIRRHRNPKALCQSSFKEECKSSIALAHVCPNGKGNESSLLISLYTVPILSVPALKLQNRHHNLLFGDCCFKKKNVFENFQKVALPS